jgi:hypothetical protein
MRTIGIAATTLTAAITASLWLAGPATAAPTGGTSASDTVKWLQDQGYNVVLNGRPNGPLSQCIATGIHGMRDSNVDANGRRIDPSKHTTVYIDLSCNTTV